MSRYSSGPGGAIQFKMPGYSWRMNPAQKDIESGDKVLLSSGVLHSLLQRFGERPLPSPLTFEITNTTTRRVSHCGVLEFSADQAVCFMPAWMQANLALKEGGEVQLRLKELPLATALTLQPLRWEFGTIATPKVALEHALRSFTALTVGDTVRIRIGATEHDLTVMALAPEAKRAAGHPNACGVVNAHLAVDFLPPLESEPESAKPVELALGVPQAGQAEGGAYRYFRAKSIDSGAAVQIEVTPLVGDPEIVVSTQTNKPELTACTWKSVGSAASSAAAASITNGSAAAPSVSPPKRITINPTSLGFITGWYYVGVYAYKADCEFEVCVREVAPIDANGSEQQRPTGPSVGSLASTDPNAKLCDTCHAYVSQKAYSLHTVQCARLNVYCAACAKPIRKSEMASHAHCDQCSAVMHPNDLAKHVDLVHASVPCGACGEPVVPQMMASHRKDTCTHRPVHCRYCVMELAAHLQSQHETFCGATSDACEICSKMVPRRRMDIHLAVDHRINLSQQPGDRSSMGVGSRGAPLTHQQMVEQRRQAAMFTTKDDPTKGTPAAQPPQQFSESEEVARAIAASMGEDPDAQAHIDADAALQHALEESRLTAAAESSFTSGSFLAASSSSSSAFAASFASSTLPPSAPAPALGSGDSDDEWGAENDDDDDDGMHDDEDSAVQTWDEDDEAAAPPTGTSAVAALSVATPAASVSGTYLPLTESEELARAIAASMEDD